MADEVNNRRELGELAAHVKSLAENQVTFRRETREDFKSMFAKLDTIAFGGCAVGKRNVERIVELERRPEKATALWANIASVLAMIIAALAFWRHTQ